LGNGKVQALNFHLESLNGEVLQAVKSSKPIVFCFDFENRSCMPGEKVSFSCGVYTYKEYGLFHYYSDFLGVYFTNMPPKNSVRCALPSLLIFHLAITS